MSVVDRDSVQPVAQSRQTGHVGADEVSRNDVSVIGNVDTGTDVAANQIPFDFIARAVSVGADTPTGARNIDSMVRVLSPVAQGSGAAHVGTDIVPRDDHIRPVSLDPRATAAADDISLRFVRNTVPIGTDDGADGHRACPHADKIAQNERSGHVGTDIVPRDDHATCANIHAVSSVAANDVALGIVGHAIAVGPDAHVCSIHTDTVRAVGDCKRSGGIRSDIVARDYRVGGGGLHRDAGAFVAANDVAFGRVGNAVAVRADPLIAASHRDALVRVAQRLRSAGVRTDVVPGDDDARGPGSQHNAVLLACADHVAFGYVGDAVAIGADADVHAVNYQDSVSAVAQSGRARNVRADIVAGDDHAADPRTFEEYAFERIAADYVSLFHVADAVAVRADAMVRAADVHAPSVAEGLVSARVGAD